MKKAVILISGGIDSAVCSYIAKNRGLELYGLTIDYGQSLKKEIVYAKKTIRKLGFKQHKIIKIINLNKIVKSSLINQGIKIPKNRSLRAISSGIPSTYVPARNIIFLSIAAGYCEKVGAQEIYVGFNSIDYSGYPDCREAFIKAMEITLNKGIAKAVNGKVKIKILAPLLHLNKEQIIRKGAELEVDFSSTWTCYKGEAKPCRGCDACILREQGFEKAKIPDPLIGGRNHVYS